MLDPVIHLDRSTNLVIVIVTHLLGNGRLKRQMYLKVLIVFLNGQILDQDMPVHAEKERIENANGCQRQTITVITAMEEEIHPKNV